MKQSQQDGFTLIEVMISILLTAVAIIGIMALYMTETKASAYSRHATEATVLAADKVEQTRTVFTPTAGTVTETGLDSMGQSGGIYTRATTIGALTDSAWYPITVVVMWSEDGVTKSATVRGRRGQL